MLSVVLVGADLTISLLGAGLVVLGFALFIATVMLWRGAASDPPVLAPLEVMADRRFARADHGARQEILASHREAAPDVTMDEIESSMLFREPISEPERPWRDPYPHDDDAVDIVPAPTIVIDPLLRRGVPENPESEQ